MSYHIICPYCFHKFEDDEVLFRSERVNQGECDILPDEYDDIGDFTARYRGDDKEEILQKYRDWEFFAESDDADYERFWQAFNGTTESNPADQILRVKAYRRKIIDPRDLMHQRYLRTQPDGEHFIRDDQGMVTQIELVGGERCNRRVCPKCHNPLPDNYGKNPVRFATIIGITGSGKTVYLSQLLRAMRTYATKVGLTAVVNNPGVRTFLENNAVTAEKPLPGSTPETRFQQPLFYEMIRESSQSGRITETFVLYDVAGEVFKDAALIKKFAPFVEQANGILFLIDPMQFDVVTGAAAIGEELDEPSMVLDAVHNILSRGKTNTKCDVPIAVCISKIDTQAVQHVLSDELRRLLLEDVHGIRDSRGFNKPQFNTAGYNPIAKELNEFILTHKQSLAQQLMINYSSYGYFAFTALGCDVAVGERENGEQYRYPVGPVLPKRVEEPVLWLFHKLGYIGTEGKLFNPAREIIECPACHCDDTHELPANERVIRSGWLFGKKETIVTYGCGQCGNKW